MARVNKISTASSKKDRKLFDDLPDQAISNVSTSSENGEATMGTRSGRSTSARRQLTSELQQSGNSTPRSSAKDTIQHSNDIKQELSISTSRVADARSNLKSPPPSNTENEILDSSLDSTPTSSNELSSPMKTFRCSHCPFSCNQVVKLNRHQNKHYVKADHQCTYCSFSCRSADILDQHLRLHTTPTEAMMNSTNNGNNNNKITDPQQEQVVVGQQQLQQQQRAEPQVRSLPQSLDVGSAKSENSATAAGTPTRPFKSPSAMPAFVKTPLLHLPTAPDTPATVKKKKNLLCCTMCPYKTMHGCDMKAHTKMHEPPARLYSCGKCSYSAMRMNALRTHELLHSGVQPEHIRIVTTPAAERTADIAPITPGPSAGGPSTSAAATVPSPAPLAAATSTAQVDVRSAAPITASPAPTDPAKDSAKEEANSSRYIEEPSPIGTVWRDTEEPEVTLRIIHDRSSRFIGEKRCRLVDYEGEQKRDDKLNFYRCCFCYGRFQRYLALFEHMRDHFTSKRGKTRYTCKSCDFTTDKLVHIRNHKSVHAGETSPADRSLSAKEEEDREEQEGETENATGQMQSIATAEMADSSVKVEDQPSNGSSEKMANKHFSCTDCPYKASTYAKLWHHMQKHKKSLRFSCTQCTFSTGAVHCLHAHTRLHTAGGEITVDSGSPDSSLEEDDDGDAPSAASTGGGDGSFCEFTLPEELTRGTGASTAPPRLGALPLEPEECEENEDDCEDEELMDAPHALVSEKESRKEDNIDEDAAPLLDEYPPTLTTFGVEADSADEYTSPAKSLTLEGVAAPVLEAPPPIQAHVAAAKPPMAQAADVPPPATPEAATPSRKRATPKNATTTATSTTTSITAKSTPVREFRMCTRKRHLQTPFATTRRATAAERAANASTTAPSAARAAPPKTEPAATSATNSAPDAAARSVPKKTVVFDTKKVTRVMRKRLNLDVANEESVVVPAPKPAETSMRKKARLQCAECPFECTEKLMLELHVKLHRGRRPFKCNVCSYNCFTAESLHSHLSLHAPPLSPTSAQAVRRRRYAGLPPPPANVSLAASAALMGGVIPVAGVSAAAAAERSVSPMVNGANGAADEFESRHPIQCPQCTFKTVHQDKFLVHRMEHVQLLQQRLGTMIKRAQAQLASETTRKNNANNNAGPKPKPRRPARRTDRMHLCNRCHFRCNTAAAYSRHLEFHGNTRAIFRCSFCDYGAQTHNVVLFHERNHHADGSLTLMHRRREEKQRIEAHNRRAMDKLAVPAKRRKLEKDSKPQKRIKMESEDSAAPPSSSSEPSSPSQPPSNPSGTTPPADNNDNGAIPTTANGGSDVPADENDKGCQMQPGMIRCVRCDLIYYGSGEFCRHWEDKHANVANATKHDIEIAALLRMGLAPRNAMRIVC